ncbi:MAG: polysaccharide deacetylase family protein [Patescibacteria group bacterium]|nr:polysaccharide deacetylase family protein [Patescibacteria group bacterium]
MKKKNIKLKHRFLPLTLLFLLFVLGFFYIRNAREFKTTYVTPVVSFKDKPILSSTSSATSTSSPSVVQNKDSLIPNIQAAPKITQNASGYCLNVPVLTYHHVQPESLAKQLGQISGTVDNGFFDQQMAYLASHGYHTITVAELVNALKSHSALPPKSLAVTLDDGYVDDYSYVLPIIKKYNITINLMIATGLVGNPDFISWDQLREMKGTGLVYFTDHTWSHYAVGRGPQDKIQYEITTGKQQLEQNIGQAVNIFTYPYGSFSPNAIQTLQQDGFIGAFSTIPGFLQCDSFIMTLHRNHVGNASLSAYGL